MAAYAALVSLMYIIEQIQHHPRPPISLHQKQVESLTENITFLQDFLEVYNYHVRNDGLESRIRDAAHAAEDVIESRMVDQILGQSNSSTDDLFYQDLQKVIQNMDFIKKEVMEIDESMGSIQDHVTNRSSSPEAPSSRLSPPTMVGFDGVLTQLMDIIRQRSSNRQIIPIVGMGGIGKTTLARNVYEHSFIVQHFDIRAWATISQEYSVREIVLQLLLCHRNQDSLESFSQMSDQKLKEMLHKRLFGKRYLIILDDMWNIRAWHKVKFLFPDNNTGSRIIITSRLSNMALHITGGQGLEMDFLKEDMSWNLLCKIVFGEGGCPLELEAIGQKIAKNCKGLPLALVVIGGLLAKSNLTWEYWEYIADNLSSIVNLENNAQCLNLLYQSYNHLPVHLKPCFLYFGVFSEDREISVFELFNLWVTEGFLKPIRGKSLEEVAEEYLRDLVERNLVLVGKWKHNGKVKQCMIHDLLRDLCLREAEKEKFLRATMKHSHSIIPHGLNTYRRIALHRNISEEEEFLNALQSASDVRSFIYNFQEDSQLLDFRLLRVLKAHGRHSLEAIFSQVVNLRLISIRLVGVPDYLKFPSSVNRLWNLHTLIVGDFIKTTLDIWKMPQLRHVKIWRLCLPCSSGDRMHGQGDLVMENLQCSASDRMHGQGDLVLENLQTLRAIENFRCSKKIVKRVPNIKELNISYSMKRPFIGSCYCLNNLGRFEKLKKLSCRFNLMEELISRSDLLQNLAFPRSLKKLTLSGSRLHWEDISTKIGPLPFLEVLKLRGNSFIGPQWKTVEGQFCSLKFLQIDSCDDLECWKTDDTHFPCLEQLVLVGLRRLKEIPTSIGHLPTLRLIQIERCCDSAILSAKEIMEEQEGLANEDLQVQAIIRRKNRELQSLASYNFLVQVDDCYD